MLPLHFPLNFSFLPSHRGHFTPYFTKYVGKMPPAIWKKIENSLENELVAISVYATILPMKKRAALALDIDGTITDERHLIPDEVAHYLKELSQHFEIFLITGRSFTFAESSITKLEFPYTLAVQHGADILSMPDKKLLHRHYISAAMLSRLDTFFEREPEDYIIYAGYDRGDFCYYRPHMMSESLRAHCRILERFSPTEWVSTRSYKTLDQGEFPLLKYFGKAEAMHHLQAKMGKIDELHTCVIRDPLDTTLSLLLMTDKEADKGHALKRILNHHNLDLPVIAAGDDNNDRPMLEQADIAIVVETAPQALHHVGDILAKPSKDLGIIPALEEAIKRL